MVGRPRNVTYWSISGASGSRQDAVNRASGAPVGAAAAGVVGGMWEDILAGTTGLLLIAYLLDALIHPDRY